MVIYGLYIYIWVIPKTPGAVLHLTTFFVTQTACPKTPGAPSERYAELVVCGAKVWVNLLNFIHDKYPLVN